MLTTFERGNQDGLGDRVAEEGQSRRVVHGRDVAQLGLGAFVHQGDASDRGARRFGLGHVAAVRGDHEQVQGNTAVATSRAFLRAGVVAESRALARSVSTRTPLHAMKMYGPKLSAQGWESKGGL